MAYTNRDFPTKKALKEAVAKSDPPVRIQADFIGGVRNPESYTGQVYLEGPHYPKPHTWYAQADVVDGVVVHVR